MAKKPEPLKVVKTEACNNCVYGLVNNKTSVICRRFPPKITGVEDQAVTSHFPLVTANNWCGEWRHTLPGGGS